MRFEYPWVLLLLAAVPLLAWRRPAQTAAPFSSGELLQRLPAGTRARLAGLPFWLRLAALALLILAMAQPKTGGAREREVGRGTAIEIVIDRSGSMDGLIFYGGKPTSRLAVAKDALRRFVFGDGARLKGRGSDLIGIVAFALRPETLAPLTLSHDSFPALLERLRTADRETENRTAIGDGIALAAARLKESAANVKSKTIILLTDGENNAGVRSVWEAANLAKAWGIRVHAVGIVSPVRRYNATSRFASERELLQLAELCGGIYRSVQDGEGLNAVYAEIDRLEKSELARTRYAGGADRFAGFAATAVLLLAAGSLLSATWLRTLP